MTKRISYKHKNGSALIIAILLVSFVTTMILGVGRFIANEVKVNSIYRDELVARYAAESGIESALYLLESNDTFANTLKQYQYDSGGDPYVLDGTLNSGAGLTETPTFETTLSRFVDVATINLNRDDAVELSFGGGEEITWSVEPGDITPSPDTCPKPGDKNRFFLYLETEEYRDDEIFVNQQPVDAGFLPITQSALTAPYKVTTGIDTNGKKARFRPYVTKREVLGTKADFQNTDDKHLFMDPSCSYSMKFTVTSTSGGLPTLTDQGNTTILSTGRYDKVKKALQAKIANKSGRAVEIFDYTIFAGQKLTVD